MQERAQRFGLTEVMDALPLAVAMIHGPEVLILDQPTSGVDSVARDAFGQMMIDLARPGQGHLYLHAFHE